MKGLVNNMLLPKISIIIPVFNLEKYISKCIESVIKQSYKNLEIIIIDSSTDQSRSISDNYSINDSRVIVIHQEAQGIAVARNSGLDIATGEYIGFVDGDDWIEFDMFELLYKNLVKFDADISICSHNLIDEEGNICLQIIDNVPNDHVEVLKGTNILKQHLVSFDERSRAHSVIWNKLYKKHLFNKLRFPINKTHEDMFTTYKLLARAKIAVLSSEHKYNYLLRKDSQTKTMHIFQRFNYLEANIELYNFIKLNFPDFESHCRRVLLKCIIIMLYWIEESKGTKIYANEIDNIVKMIKSHDIYTCGLLKEQIKILELFIENIRLGFAAIKFSHINGEN
jgi:glycosyltransferase involved in cell wall biosynthesis